MEDRNTAVFKALLDPQFDWSNFDLETLIGLGMEIVDNKKIAHRVIGKLAIAQSKLKNKMLLKDFAKEVGENPSSVRRYKSIEEQFEGILLPPDLSWGAERALAEQNNPKEVLKEVIEHGFSNPEIIKTFARKNNKRQIICPKCEQEIEI